MELYFQAVRACVKEGSLSKEAYVRLLTSSNQAGFTPLHQVCLSGSLTNLRRYFEECQAYLNKEEIAKLLSAKTKQGYLPNCRNKSEANAINQFIERQRREYGVSNSASDERYSGHQNKGGQRERFFSSPNRETASSSDNRDTRPRYDDASVSTTSGECFPKYQRQEKESYSSRREGPSGSSSKYRNQQDRRR